MTDNTPAKIYVKKIKNRKYFEILFKIKRGYYLEILTSAAMELLRNTENKITRDKNGENVTYLEITEVVFIHYNTVKNDYQHNLIH